MEFIGKIVVGLDAGVVVVEVIPDKSVDGWCNVVTGGGGGCDDTTWMGAVLLLF